MCSVSLWLQAVFFELWKTIGMGLAGFQKDGAPEINRQEMMMAAACNTSNSNGDNSNSNNNIHDDMDEM